jgi:uncharacterized membrane protein
MALSLGSGSRAIAFLVAAGIVYEIIAKACSSPQTTELNAPKRAPTLMKWVNIGTAEAAVFVAIAAALEKDTRGAVLLGGTLAAVITYAEYAYAKQSGLRNGGPPTEEYP